MWEEEKWNKEWAEHWEWKAVAENRGWKERSEPDHDDHAKRKQGGEVE